MSPLLGPLKILTRSVRSLSKFYVEDACISNRDNSLGLSSVQDVTCSKASDSSTATCTAVFQNGGEWRLGHALMIEVSWSDWALKTQAHRIWCPLAI